MSNKGFRIIKKINRPSKDVLNQFKKYPTPNIADNINRFFCMSSKIKKMNEKNIKLVGPAFTVKARVTDNLLIHKALDIAEPGDILVIDAEGDINHAMLGEIMVSEAIQRELGGIIVDGAIRDFGEIKKMDFPVFARGANPRGPYKDGPGEINTVISCGGVVIKPGDILVGDEDGIVIVPIEEMEEILEKTKITFEKEMKILSDIRKGIIRSKDWVDTILSNKGCEIIE
ncbi:MAG: RraA family protein [Eubacteriaceae bacterium]